MECIYCEYSLPNNAKFCPKCLRQIICIDCGEVLFKDSSICISCGNPLKNSNYSNNDAINNIEFTENENGKTFKASFTNTVAGNVVETFAQLLPMNYSSKKYLQPAQKENDFVDIANAEVLESAPNLISNPANFVASNNQSNLEKIFKNKNGSISIYDTRIKAVNRKDFVARITLLFLYYKRTLGFCEVERVELNAILSSEKLYDGGFRSWLSANRTLIDNKQTYLELRPEGIELAEKYLSDFLDNSIPNLWDLKNGKKNSSAKNDLKDNIAVTGDKSKTSKKIITYNIVQSLNLKPLENKSLVDFCAEYSASSNFDYNLLFVYYLERVLGEKSININHVYTCYKALNVKVPNIYQSIADTKKRKGWIDSSNMNDLKISVAGENHLEHTMKKNKK